MGQQLVNRGNNQLTAMQISRTSRKDGKSRFGLKWSSGSEKPCTKFFETEKEREEYRAKLKRKAKREGVSFLAFSPAQAALLSEALSMAGNDALTVIKAVELWNERNALNNVTVVEAVKLFLDDKYNLGRDDNWVRANRNILDRFSDYVGEGSLCDCSRDQAQAWLLSLHYAPVTLNNHKKSCGSFFNWCVDRRYCHENIFKNVSTPIITPPEPDFLKVDQTIKLFQTAAKHFPDLLAYLAMRAFGGIRSSACSRIPIEDINFENRGILITAKNAKNNQRDFLQGHPDNLWAWLEFSRDNFPEGFSLTERMHRRRHAQNIEKAKFQPPHNALRHSFATYHVALLGDAGRTSRLLTHRSEPHLLFAHYKGISTREDAEKYFSITPDKILKANRN